MSRQLAPSLHALAFVSAVAFAGPAQAQLAYGVNANGTLFRFDVDAPAAVTSIGQVGFVPEGIDFRPGTNDLYAIDIGEDTAQLYQINVNSAFATAIGAPFATAGQVDGVNYLLSTNDTFGFDFNPKTLQPDDSMRIRLVGTSGVNLRLNSATGQITNVDGTLLFGNGNSPFIDAAAYINNVPGDAGATSLYDMDSRNDALLLQNPPNAGTVATIGTFGFGIDGQRNIGFDVYTTPGDGDPTIVNDFGFAVFTRPDAPIGDPGIYLLYDVNLATGATTGGAIVGPVATPFDFEGGFAVAPIPEPGSLALVALAATGLVWRARRRGGEVRKALQSFARRRSFA